MQIMKALFINFFMGAFLILWKSLLNDLICKFDMILQLRRLTSAVNGKGKWHVYYLWIQHAMCFALKFQTLLTVCDLGNCEKCNPDLTCKKCAKNYFIAKDGTCQGKSIVIGYQVYARQHIFIKNFPGCFIASLWSCSL